MPVRQSPLPWREHPGRSESVTTTLRNAVCDWLLEFQHAFGLSQNTVCVAVSYLDKYLSVKSVEVRYIRLVATCAILIATKLHESDPIKLSELTAVTEHSYTAEQFRAMELDILQSVKWRVNPITPLDIAYSMISLCVATMPDEEEKELVEYTEAFLDLSMCEHSFLRFTPSVQAAASIRCAFHMLGVFPKSWERLQVELGVSRFRCLEECEKDMLKYFFMSFPELKPSRASAHSPTGITDLVVSYDSDDEDEEDADEGIDDELRDVAEQLGSAVVHQRYAAPSPSRPLVTPTPTVFVGYGPDSKISIANRSPMSVSSEPPPFVARSASPVQFTGLLSAAQQVRPIAEYASPSLRPNDASSAMAAVDCFDL